jgi:urease accessory protein
MMRASEVLPAGTWDATRERSTIALPYDGRHRRRLAQRSASGVEFLLDLAEARALRDGDGLPLDDGTVVRVVASPEPVADVDAAPHLLLRVAWHIGNRHVPCELLPDRIRIARDHVLEAMIRGLGATVRHVDAPFHPEAGAYAGRAPHRHTQTSGAHAHDHDDGHGHEHEDGTDGAEHRHGR